LNNLRQELQLTIATDDGGGIKVVDKATISSPGSGFLGKYWNIFMAVVVTGLISLICVALIQYFGVTVRTLDQAGSYLGLPVMAIAGGGFHSRGRRPSVLEPGNKNMLESFRILRTNLGLDSQSGKVLLITSPKEQEGKTMVAANLARVVALQGRKVLLVDSDTVSAKSGMSQVFKLLKISEITKSSSEIDSEKTDEDDRLSRINSGAPEPASLTELVTRNDGMWGYANNEDSVDIISLGRVSNPVEITSSPRMEDFITKSRRLYDVVIFDGPPVIGHADTRILAKQMDEVLLVLRKDVSRLDLAKESKAALETVGSNVSGFVLVG
jgi:Mrp family chromosome partitioning ATPase